MSSVKQSLRKAKHHAKQGDTDIAAQQYQHILKEFPKNRQAIKGLKALQKTVDNPNDMDSRPKNKPSHEQICHGLIELYRQGQRQEALRQGETLQRQFPEVAFIPNFLGVIYVEFGHLEKAVESFKKSLKINPNSADAHNNLGVALKEFGRFEEAADSYRQALQIRPDYFEAHNNLGNALKNLSKPEEAVTYFHQAIQIKPDYFEAHNNLGNALKTLGEHEEAIACFQQALQIKPNYTEAYRNLSKIKKYQNGDPLISQMLELIERDNLSNNDRIQLSFALGKVLDDIGDYDNAFSYLLDGNRLRKEELKFDIASSRTQFSNIKSTFSEEISALNAFEFAEDPARVTEQKPIFILGMPRSGTTLVEQILASHSQVFGAGELALLDQSIDNNIHSTPLSLDQLQGIRASYYSGLKKIGASESYITDKMPSNFLHIGFILTAIPEATIIHVKRDARATCWSNFKCYYPVRANGFVYNLKDVAEYYKLYVDMMQFWHDRFPERIVDLNYEALTEHQDEETRRLLKQVGIDWEVECLQFHKSNRAVLTASTEQVRQKIYQGSSEVWRKYEKHLKPMLEALGDA